MAISIRSPVRLSQAHCSSVATPLRSPPDGCPQPRQTVLPDLSTTTTRRRILDVHVLADDIQIFEDGTLIANHSPLEGRDQKRLDPTHRKVSSLRYRRRTDDERSVVRRTGDQVARRSLDYYDAVARRLAKGGVR